MENLVGGVRQGSNETSEQFQENIDVEQIPEDAEALQRLRVSSSGEDSEDSERRQKNSIPSNKDSSSSNWSPRTALRHLSSFRRKSRDVKRKGSGDARSYSFSSGVRQSPSPSRKSLPRRFSRNAIEEKSSSTISPAPPIRIATRSISPAEVEDIKNSHLEEIVSVSPTNKPEKIITNEENDSKNQKCENSPVLDKSKTGSKESLIKNHISSSPSTVARDNENMNVEVLKQNIKLHINSKKLSENPRKSLSRSGLSPGTLKKAFQFTRSSSWTQRKLANASPPCIPKIRQEPPQPKEPNNSPSESPRRPSLIRASSFDTPNAGTPSPKGTPKNEILKELKTESLETPEEDENEADDDSDKSDDEDDDISEKTWGIKKERGSVQHDRSQELDSPSNAALPILETPSVRGCEAAWVLRTLMLVRAPHLLQDRKSGNVRVPRCGIGAEMTEWLLNQSSSIHSRAQAAAMWQVLLEEGALIHVTCEQPFRDKFLFYRFLEDNDVPSGKCFQHLLHKRKKMLKKDYRQL
ncbi:Rap guanine nucleotide exchange factor 4 [Armadillidium vulgare]|nr:Rap guanine nucleotide exchange factor 4 [Armadillidium vulgare]